MSEVLESLSTASDGQAQIPFGHHPLALYDAARKALAACLSTDEVKNIRDSAEAMRAYGLIKLADGDGRSRNPLPR